MKKNLTAALMVWLSLMPLLGNEPDSAYLFAYATTKNAGHNGLHYAWSTNGQDWQSIGREYRWMGCDYGAWGSQKRMLTPYLYLDQEGAWHSVWSVNEQDPVIAHTTSKDLIYWKVQRYPEVASGQCLLPTISRSGNTYTLSWLTEGQAWYTSTSDFKAYTPAKAAGAAQRADARQTVTIRGEAQTGTVHKVAWTTISNLLTSWQATSFKSQLHAERITDDATRFAQLKPLEVTVTVDTNRGKAISDQLMGIFFEDISYAADGGLYAELVQNRGFEYTPADHRGWNSQTAWTLSKTSGSFTIDTVKPIHINNKHYAVLEATSTGVGLVNDGFDGIALEQGESYRFSLFARAAKGYKGKLKVSLLDEQGTVVAQAVTKNLNDAWKQQTLTLKAGKTLTKGRLEVALEKPGTVHLDMVSLFPVNTFKGRRNGLRADLAQVIADLHPRFVRFPGGCVAHGNGLHNMYRWKNTIGPLEARVPQPNIWNYHQTAGLGYFEYFQFCEDIGAEPLPVVPAGVPCQNSSHGGAGQQGGIPLCEMDDYIQEVLDLIEWANGDVKTTWGRKRAEAGHPNPFNLKYLGVGNEDLISDVFEERFTMIFKAVKEKYPKIVVVGTAGPFNEGSDYTEGWRIGTELGVPMLDEHYYQSPGWFMNNQDFYDRYDRNKSKVYLGEYAAHIPGRRNTIETALAEAIYLTALERNADIVQFSSYAPLLAKEGHTNWNPDLIYFNNTEIKPTVGYYVQQLFGQHAGDRYYPSLLTLSNPDEAVRKRVGASVVTDSHSGDVIVKLVNILPVSTKTTVNLTGMNVPEGDASITVLQGRPEDRNAKPTTSTLRVGNSFPVELPAYSLTVIRIKKD